MLSVTALRRLVGNRSGRGRRVTGRPLYSPSRAMAKSSRPFRDLAFAATSRHSVGPDKFTRHADIRRPTSMNDSAPQGKDRLLVDTPDITGRWLVLLGVSVPLLFGLFLWWCPPDLFERLGGLGFAALLSFYIVIGTPVVTLIVAIGTILM